MRQETTNTFDKGLNKDLNPVVTPNDVLTDCLNGTFVTFNGDELTLQNDSGNTTVPVPGKDSVVKLSKGFYPVGIKEYGGVLYIVSGKKGLRDKEGNYIRDEYKRIIEEDQIEFGSYPSPQFAWPQEVENNIVIENYSRDTLYRTSIINDTIFKTGGYVRFSPTSTNPELPDHLWTPQTLGGLYVIKLQHQLESGVYDLTDAIWEKYTEYLNNAPNNPEHWINSENFKFYCPTKYKGKLAIKIELNEPEYFEFEEIPTAILSGDKFDLKIQVKWKDSKALKIIGYNLTVATSEGHTETYEYNKGDLTSIYTIPLDTTILSYEVTPRLEYLGDEYSWDAFPEDFKEKFILQGRMFLGAEHLGLKLLPRDGNCLKMGEIGTGKRQYNTYILSKEGKMFDQKMDLIEEGELTLPAIITLRETEPITKGSIIGTFNADINNWGKISINTGDSEYITWKEGLNSDLKRTTVEAFENMHEYSIVRDQSCSSQYFYISFNYEITSLNINWIFPDMRATYVYDSKEGDRNIYKVLYVPGKDIRIESNGRFKSFGASEISPNVVLQVDYQPVSLLITNPKLTSSGHEDETFMGSVDSSRNVTFAIPGALLKETNINLSFGLTTIPNNLIISEIGPSNVSINFPGWQHSQISVDKLSNTYNINTTLTVKTGSSGGGGGGPVNPEFPTDGSENIQLTSLNIPQIGEGSEELLLGSIRLMTVITDEYGKDVTLGSLFNVVLAIIEL